MLDIKSKCHNKTIQLCLFKVALFFSVFTFSGYTGQAQSAPQLESITTELVESRNYTQSSNLYRLKNSFNKIDSIKFLLNLLSFNYSWTLLNINESIIIEYKSICKEYLSYKFNFLKLPTKVLLPSSKDEFLSFSII